LIFKVLTFSFLLIATIACNKTEFTKKECEELSMKKYKGYQRESHQFDNYCKMYQIHYTSSRCQKALKKLILGTPLTKLKQLHGEDIDQCFTKNDIKHFTN